MTKHNLPTTLSVLGAKIRVRVYPPPGAPGEDLAGCFLPEKMEIYVSPSQTPEEQESTLLHEVLHAALYQSGWAAQFGSEASEETFVLALEHALAPLLKFRALGAPRKHLTSRRKYGRLKK